MSCRLALVVATVLLLVGCTAPQPTAPGPAASASAQARSANQAIRIAQAALPATPSPEASNSNTPFYWALFDPLVTLDDTFNVLPWAATRWTQATPTSWRFTLRQDLRFGNGDPLTAADVAFTGKLILDTRMPQITNLANLVDVVQVDDHTVDFITKTPDASILPGLATVWIMPQKYYTSVGKDGFATKPVGSGPYELVSYRAGDMAVVRKKATDHPFRQVIPTQLTFQALPDPSAMLAGFTTGDIDVITGLNNADQIASLASGTAVVLKGLGTVLSILYSQPENQQRQTPLTDKRVRLALNYAVDKVALAKNLYRGYAEPTGQLSVPQSPSWDPSIAPYAYDPALAKQLLAEAGYPTGFTLPVGLESTPGIADPNLVLGVQGYLKAVGVEAPVNQIELAAFLDKFYGRNGQSKGDLFLTMTSDTNGFATIIAGSYTCNKPLVWWCNPAFDQAMTAAAAEPDIAKRGVLMRQAIAALRNDVSHLLLLLMPVFVVTQPTIQGFQGQVTGLYNFDQVYRTG
jgi:peptide/nickel transport system substrate-binding protein